MSFYKTGEIAKRAGVTVRTMQYYDSIGLLHPSHVDEKGYRFYSDEDMVRLQKILCLKELGFGLEDIRTMTATDSYTSIKEALHYQIMALDRKISNLTKLRDNLVSVSDAPNWSRMFHSMRMG
ncbi:MAG: MerR family transcriptional regulator, partial [Bullifex sp.]|nr:MerR family transcriptional regulator [Bullifex sp.]